MLHKFKKAQYVDINKDFTKFAYEFDELDDDELYFFDLERYKFVVKRFLPVKERKNFDNLIGKRYIRPIVFVYESLYKSLIELINNKEVTEWFLSAESEEERYNKYRNFLDYNELYMDERYRLYLIIYPMMIQWCEENHIRYRFKLLPPPKDYLYSNPDQLKDYYWEMPY